MQELALKKMMFLAMGLAGICAGLGGAERVLGGSAQYGIHRKYNG